MTLPRCLTFGYSVWFALTEINARTDVRATISCTRWSDACEDYNGSDGNCEDKASGKQELRHEGSPTEIRRGILKKVHDVI